jgi:uncharacterized protein
LAPGEKAEAQTIATKFGFRHLLINTYELENPEYRANNTNRCYFCKQELMRYLLPLAKEYSIAYIALGAIMDDLKEERPGEQAALEAGAVFPLRAAGLNKLDIRELSKAMGLPTAEKPAGACLASRIPFGQTVSAEKLRQVSLAETTLKSFGLINCRVRHHEAIARIEIPPAEFVNLLPHASSITSQLKALGFVYVTLDLQGIRSGSLHEVLRDRS